MGRPVFGLAHMIRNVAAGHHAMRRYLHILRAFTAQHSAIDKLIQSSDEPA